HGIEVSTPEPDLAGVDLAGGRGHLHQRQRSHGLARAGFTDNPEDLMGPDVEAGSVDRKDPALVSRKADPEVVDAQQWLCIAHDRSNSRLNASARRNSPIINMLSATIGPTA